MKRCSKCKTEYNSPTKHFSKKTDSKDGLKNICKKCQLEYNRLYTSLNKENVAKAQKKYRKDNLKKIKNYLSKNRERIRKRQKKYIENNIGRIREANRIYLSNRRKNDVNFRMLGNLRNRLRLAVKRTKSKHTIDLIGCSIPELKSHLENLMEVGMSWNNYGRGGWNIDHIIPCAAFDLSDSSEQKKCFHFSNLRPLWEKDNYTKNSYYLGKRFTKNHDV